MLTGTSLIPIRDDNPTRSRAIVTLVIILLNVGFFLVEPQFGSLRNCSSQAQGCNEGNNRAARFLCRWGTVPTEITHQAPDSQFACPPSPAKSPAVSLLSSMFLHGGWLHLLGNMLFLWIFGNNIEDVLGKTRYVAFYLLCGLIAALAHVFVNATSGQPTIGASGAIAGVLGAYIVLFPRARVTTIVPVFLLFTARLPAALVLGLWFVSQLFIGHGQTAEGGVAWMAHVGGFIAGVVLIIAFGGFKRRSSVPVF